MPKRRKYQILSQQFSKPGFATKVNDLTLRLTFFSVLIAIFMTKYAAEQFVKSSAQYSLNLPTQASGSSVQVAAKSPITPLQVPGVEVAVKSSPPQNSKSLTPPVPDWAVTKLLPIPSRQPEKQDLKVVYNLKKPPNFKQSQELQTIVNDVVELATAQNLPTKALSITLIDAKTGETAGYQQNTPRYPASVIKMFWMVVLYAQIENGIWQHEKDFTPYLAKMIQESDNEAASFILDEVTGTRSEPELKSENFKLWKNKRQQINQFFRQADYNNISIIQKTFPIDYINLPEPQGSESQLLGNSQNWNRITTQHAARLLYEVCYTRQAISVQASKKMCGWLKRDLNPKVWQPSDSYDFNPVRTFFGESLPHNRLQFYSKAGWTSISRAEAAMVVTENRKATYILAIFAPDSAYADDVEIFPKMSRLVYNRMTSRSIK